MADSHEEQLLNGLLGDIAREDACLDASHLESRIMAAARQAEIIRRQPTGAYLVIAAAVLATALLPALFRTPQIEDGNVSPRKDATEVTLPVSSESTPVATAPSAAPPAVRTVRSSFTPRPESQTAAHIAQLPITQSPIAESPIAQSPIAQSPDEFLPLMPITAQELAGSFQIVRVQMPRASLGALRSALEQPNELVEADVLLGEDGMARGIRLSTSGSVSPWRPR